MVPKEVLVGCLEGDEGAVELMHLKLSPIPSAEHSSSKSPLSSESLNAPL